MLRGSGNLRLATQELGTLIGGPLSRAVWERLPIKNTMLEVAIGTELCNDCFVCKTHNLILQPLSDSTCISKPHSSSLT